MEYHSMASTHSSHLRR